jgi:seryl-tRNA synthetase
LNGTAVTARTAIALLENFQDEAGAVAVPEPLWAYGAPRKLGGGSPAS